MRQQLLWLRTYQLSQVSVATPIRASSFRPHALRNGLVGGALGVFLGVAHVLGVAARRRKGVEREGQVRARNLQAVRYVGGFAGSPSTVSSLNRKAILTPSFRWSRRPGASISSHGGISRQRVHTLVRR